MPEPIVYVDGVLVSGDPTAVAADREELLAAIDGAATLEELRAAVSDYLAATA